MTKVLAKVVCSSATPIDGEQKRTVMDAVMNGSEENKSFSRWTPVLNIHMVTSNETTAGDYFEPGAEYYVTFEKVIK